MQRFPLIYSVWSTRIALSLLLVALIGGWRDRTMDSAGVGLRDFEAARITLLLLRTVVGYEPVKGVAIMYTLTPNEDLLTEDVAVAALAALPKPLQCSSAKVRDYIALTCGPIREDDDRKLHAFLYDSSAREGVFGTDLSVGESKVELRTSHQTITVSSQSIAHWRSSYLIAHPISYARTSPDANARQSGIRYVINVQTVVGIHSGER